MAYIVAQYYIGPMCRYDGSGNTDQASLFLFKDRDKAVEFIINQINESIQQDNEDNPDQPRRTFDDLDNLNKRLEEYGTYNFDDVDMFTLEFAEIQ